MTGYLGYGAIRRCMRTQRSGDLLLTWFGSKTQALGDRYGLGARQVTRYTRGEIVIWCNRSCLAQILLAYCLLLLICGFPLNTLWDLLPLAPASTELLPLAPAPSSPFAPERCAGHGSELSHYLNGRLEAFIRVILMPLIKYLRFRQQS